MTEEEIQQPTWEEEFDLLPDECLRGASSPRQLTAIKAFIALKIEQAVAKERETISAMADESYKQGVRDGTNSVLEAYRKSEIERNQR